MTAVSESMRTMAEALTDAGRHQAALAPVQVQTLARLIDEWATYAEALERRIETADAPGDPVGARPDRRTAALASAAASQTMRREMRRITREHSAARRGPPEGTAA